MEDRIKRLEDLLAMYSSQQVVTHELLVKAVRSHPQRVELLRYFRLEMERRMAFWLNSRLPTDDWLHLLQVHTENAIEDCTRPGQDPSPDARSD